MEHIKLFVVPLSSIGLQLIQCKKLKAIPISFLMGRHQMSPLCFDLPPVTAHQKTVSFAL